MGMMMSNPCNLLSHSPCGNDGATNKGQQLHADIERWGFLDKDLYVEIVLVNMLKKCSFLTEALNV